MRGSFVTWRNSAGPHSCIGKDPGGASWSSGDPTRRPLVTGSSGMRPRARAATGPGVNQADSCLARGSGTPQESWLKPETGAASSLRRGTGSRESPGTDVAVVRWRPTRSRTPTDSATPPGCARFNREGGVFADEAEPPQAGAGSGSRTRASRTAERASGRRTAIEVVAGQGTVGQVVPGPLAGVGSGAWRRAAARFDRTTAGGLVLVPFVPGDRLAGRGDQGRGSPSEPVTTRVRLPVLGLVSGSRSLAVRAAWRRLDSGHRC